jgi:hypothetical protein
MREARRSPFARRGGRVIGTDMLRMSPLLHVSSDGQEREQGSKDDANVNAHQRNPRAPVGVPETPPLAPSTHTLGRGSRCGARGRFAAAAPAAGQAALDFSCTL